MGLSGNHILMWKKVTELIRNTIMIVAGSVFRYWKCSCVYCEIKIWPRVWGKDIFYYSSKKPLHILPVGFFRGRSLSVPLQGEYKINSTVKDEQGIFSWVIKYIFSLMLVPLDLALFLSLSNLAALLFSLSLLPHSGFSLFGQLLWGNVEGT